MRLRDLSILLVVAGVLLAGEASLELRAHFKGQDTPISVVLDPLFEGTSWERPSRELLRPTPEFPFASERFPAGRGGAHLRPRIWISSSSYALGREPTFPHIVQDVLRASGWPDAVVLTQAEPGLSVSDNVRRLVEDGDTWEPDVAVLYQLTNDLHELARSAADGGEPTQGLDAGFSSGARILRSWYEETSVYGQLSVNFTPWFSQHQLTPAALPPHADSVFAERVRSWISAARDLGASPLLVTLATSHHLGEPLPRDARFWMLRWNPYYRPEAYLATLEAWNRLIEEIARQEAVPLLDANALLSGRPDQYLDLVHFREEARHTLGEALAAEVARLLEARTPSG